MPNLRHLQISGLPAIEEQNVLAILDGSPLLQCLDLSRCISSVHMGSSLDNRCRAQMKD
ncbi:Leucine-rich repeat domain superfamily [Sesbania bispinosa]|nr:Leucine-rich repeat domain superfamily [Sesbania bispinosa]